MAMPTTSDFADVNLRLRRGDADAGQAIFARFGLDLIRLAAPRLRGLLKSKVDAEDVVQSAFRSFFRAHGDGSFELNGWNDLWALLVTITLRKCRYQHRRFQATKRDVRREHSLGGDWELPATGPRESDAAEFVELLSQLLGRVAPHTRVVAELALRDESPAEIARQVGLTTRSVYRHLERLKDELQQMESAEEASC